MTEQRHWLDSVEDILTASTGDLRKLAEIAGENPENFYVGTKLDGADLRNQDLRGMKFTHLDKSKIKYNKKTQFECSGFDFKNCLPGYKDASFLNWKIIKYDNIEQLKLLIGSNPSRLISCGELTSAQFKEGARWSKLPFYENTFLIAVPSRIEGHENIFFIGSFINDTFLPLDWTNTAIYDYNTFNLNLTKINAIIYLRFFYFFVRGQLGWFQIVESASQLLWISTPSKDQIAQVSEAIFPIHFKPAPKGMFCISYTCMFKDALFSCESYIAKSNMRHYWDQNEDSTLLKGEIEIRNEVLLIENLPVHIPGPPLKIQEIEDLDNATL